jgi:hypothetical protein
VKGVTSIAIIPCVSFKFMAPIASSARRMDSGLQTT